MQIIRKKKERTQIRQMGALAKTNKKEEKEKKLHSGASDSDIFPKTYINKTKLRSKIENMTTPN